MTNPQTTSTPDRILNPQTGMDAVTLRVGDLELMSSYYAGALALTPLEERARGPEVHRVLGRGDTPMVRLISTPALPAVDPRQAGLFHTAFLFDDAAALAATVLRAAQDPRSRFTGSSDHLVSEAFYFTDPEGNGIELYVDRARDAWQYVNGELQMSTLYLDPNEYLQRHLSDAAVAGVAEAGGIVGHVHLQVGDIRTARAFYVDALGFEVTVATYPGALFASAGGYHHHVAMNTWNSGGAGPRAASLGLGNVAITVPTRDDLDALAARLTHHKLAFADDGRRIVLSDPWDTQVTVALPGDGVDDILAR
ncbi:VOC family protein [uncultured Microbacterium sp.]|uniref:Glyoxalase/bleomycin resistance protein/dioxygenase n=1 Tax=uncultured Microbacterium sp. TaxID=191216 RepID=A0A1Y5P6D1_9MICO|nr:VOC family protein [uncultured Microbacterium sp.]SBS71508.1 Glyoxalase/bleomycin resistance protein/dioxygenase [uncultured Microbacterium sp.]